MSRSRHNVARPRLSASRERNIAGNGLDLEPNMIQMPLTVSEDLPTVPNTALGAVREVAFNRPK